MAEAIEPHASPSGSQLPGLGALHAGARYHGVELDEADLVLDPDGSAGPAALATWLRGAGLWAKAARMTWAQLIRTEIVAPIVLLLQDGGAALVIAADPVARVLQVQNLSGDGAPVAIDEIQMRRLWTGEVILIRSEPTAAEDDQPFTIAWLARLVRLEGRTLGAVFLASVTLSILTILPPLVVMTVIDRIITHQSLSTLVMVSLMIGLAMIYETILGFTRRQMTLIIGARVDAKLNLHVFKRLLGLPLDFFEREQSGVIIHNTMQVNKVREFLTGKLLSTALDLVTLIVLLPVLFIIQPLLTWLVIGCAGAIALVIMVFLPAMRRAVGKWIDAETQKSSVLVECIHGIRTVKSLALEPTSASCGIAAARTPPS